MSRSSDGATTILAAVILAVGVSAIGMASSNPIEIHIHSSKSTSSFSHARSLFGSLSTWLDENIRQTTLKDHFDVFTLPPDHLDDHLSSVSYDAATELPGLEQTVTLVEKTR